MSTFAERKKKLQEPQMVSSFFAPSYYVAILAKQNLYYMLANAYLGSTRLLSCPALP
jgi:hypothetical protein